MPEREGQFVAEVNSRFELAVVDHICRPALELVPRGVHPNTLSLLTHLLVWITGACAVSSTRLLQPWRSLALLGAGIGTFLAMVGDNLDGMQARRTDRCSRLGEMMDHWLDTVAVPMVTLGTCAALELPPWAAAAVHITSTMIYNSQLVLYHYSGKFTHAGTSGVDATAGVSVGYVIFAALGLLFDRHAYGFELGIILFACGALIVQLRVNAFYWVRLRGRGVHTLPFVACCGGFAALYLLGIIGQLAFLLLVVFASFRITGGYVLHTILGRPFSGVDLGIPVLILATAALHYLVRPIAFSSLTLVELLPWLTCLYMASRSLIDFARNFSALRPAARGEGQEPA